MTDTPRDAVSWRTWTASMPVKTVAVSTVFTADGSIPDGTQVTQTGSMFTVALRRSTDGWRVAARAWSKGVQQ